jgi:hypothetical protein
MPWLDLPDALELVTQYCSSILAAIKVLSQEARIYTGRALAYGLSRDHSAFYHVPYPL